MSVVLFNNFAMFLSLTTPHVLKSHQLDTPGLSLMKSKLLSWCARTKIYHLFKTEVYPPESEMKKKPWCRAQSRNVTEDNYWSMHFRNICIKLFFTFYLFFFLFSFFFFFTKVQYVNIVSMKLSGNCTFTYIWLFLVERAD